MEHYTYRVTWSPEEEEYLGTCIEFPRLSHFDESPEATLSGIRELVQEAIAFMKEKGVAIPEPLAEKHYSGKFQVRLTPQQHRSLALEASEQGVSLNRLISSKLVSAI
jgi:predicted HicB family RNase H-like nuclease